jgi:predicted unusual protein kinase regulating ubiquinone biosynthesis (AarF/ABC1/UbiB family)
VGDLLITPANAKRLADRLSEMRGAAMKVGQLLSMESGELIPPVLSNMLSRLRESAHTMPLGEVAQVLNMAWGEDWDLNFQKFLFTPLSAASIGQVHEAILQDGRRLAIKIQYPGIRRSLDSDVDNVGTLLRLLSLVPKEIDFAPLLEEAKCQLHKEADYRLEAISIQRFSHLLGDDSRFELPTVVESLTTPEVLTMSYLDGQPIETLAEKELSVRNAAAASLLELALREVFEWGLVQTDPNFANYRYQPDTHRLQLLDFGATRDYPASRRTALRELLQACTDGDDRDVMRSAIDVGYLDAEDLHAYREGIVALLRTVTEPVREVKPYDFGTSDLVRRMSDIAIDLRVRDKFGRLPPTDVLFLHRKLGGLYLLLSHLRATVPAHQLVQPFLEQITTE